uniref:Chromophore lyase CpcS/CpeS n=1 Tax=Hydropuntia rangiferina TaxID=338881 RepID=A0A345U8C1_9FLOR|nr:hypothetical protein [Hydropuntia rangiferina]AXI96707.1 hypothetical protein [Hydropuntia rangiferina]UAD87390.1 hypothetical protein [Hydropuntia rangiferina]
MKYKNILNKLEGKWIYQRTDYYANNKNTNYYQKEIQIKKKRNINQLYSEEHLTYNYQISNREKNEEIDYIFFKPNKSNFGKIHRITDDSINYYRFIIYSCNSIKIESVQQNLIYNEYIYLINSKFRISICILKKNHKYLAISFISEIKISH